MACVYNTIIIPNKIVEYIPIECRTGREKGKGNKSKKPVFRLNLLQCEGRGTKKRPLMELK